MRNGVKSTREINRNENGSVDRLLPIQATFDTVSDVLEAGGGRSVLPETMLVVGK